MNYTLIDFLKRHGSPRDCHQASDSRKACFLVRMLELLGQDIKKCYKSGPPKLRMESPSSLVKDLTQKSLYFKNCHKE